MASGASGAPEMSVTVSILFCDVVGSTALLVHGEGQAGGDLRRQLLSSLRSVCARHHGEEVKSLGDGLMVAFGAAGSALAAASALQHAVHRLDRQNPGGEVRLRVGISLGDCAREDGDYFGPAVVEAARLCDEAGPGQILASATVVAAGRPGGGPVTRSLGYRTLKGFPDPLEVFEVECAAPPAPVALHPVLARSQRSPLVGRESELELIAGHRAAAGPSRPVVLVSGEPGIGKTRLLAAAAAEAWGAGETVLYGYCDPEVGGAYQPFPSLVATLAEICPEDVLRAHGEAHGDTLAHFVPRIARRVPDLRPQIAGDPEGERQRLFEAVDDLLVRASAEGPVALVLDDIHWAARPTLMMLRHLARSPAPAALTLVVAYRDTELAADHPLTALLGDLRRIASTIRVGLEGLAEREVAELIDNRTGRELGERGRALAYLVREATQGHAYFTAELVDHLVESGALDADLPIPKVLEVPESVREVVRGRLAGMTLLTREAVSAASVAGSGFTVSLVAEMLERPQDPDLLGALDEALRQRLIVEARGMPGGTDYVFAHTLVRRAVYGDISAARRAYLHRRAGEALAARLGTSGPHLDALSHHFVAGVGSGSALDAVHFSLGAARQLIDDLAAEQAVDLLEGALSALEVAQAIDDASRCDLLLALTEAKARIHDHDGIRAASLGAAAAARRAGSGERMAAAATWYSARAVAGERDREGVALCHEALAALPPGDRLNRSLVLSGLATQLAFEGEREPAGRASAEALAIASDLGDDRAVAFALYASYYAHWGTPQVAEQLRLADELSGQAVALPNGLLASLDAQRLRLFPLMAMGRRADLQAAVGEVERLGTELRSRYFQAAAAMWGSCIRLLDGRFEDFDNALGAAGALAGTDPNFRNAISGQVFHRQFETGGLANLVPLMEELAARAPGLAGFRAALAVARSEAGDEQAARQDLETLAADRFAVFARDVTWPASMAVLAELCAGLRDAARAAELADLLRPYSGTLLGLSAAYVAGAADRYTGMMELTAGRLGPARDCLEAGLDLEEKVGAEPLVARSEYWLAVLAAAEANQADPGPASAAVASVTRHAGRAWGIAERLGMARLADQARRLVSRS